MYEKIFVLAHLELFTGENMRRTPFISTYRPGFDFKGARTRISGRIDLIDKESLVPGTSATVQVTFLNGMINDEHLKKGVSFTFSEGRYVLGKGEIIERLASPVIEINKK